MAAGFLFSRIDDSVWGRVRLPFAFSPFALRLAFVFLNVASPFVNLRNLRNLWMEIFFSV
jgi:hypothetical protein